MSDHPISEGVEPERGVDTGGGDTPETEPTPDGTTPEPGDGTTDEGAGDGTTPEPDAGTDGGSTSGE